MRILLAEDESTISRLIEIVLAGSGHEVTGVRSVNEANTELENNAFDLVLLDRYLADGDGSKVLAALDSHQGQQPPVVLMTGERAFAHDDELPLRVQAMLWKPFELDELERMVNRFSA